MRDTGISQIREIADAIGAVFFVDMAHFAGLVAGGSHPSPFPHAHVATTTTHKTLRGPRGGVILTNDEALAKKFNSAIFPGPPGRPADACNRGESRGVSGGPATDFKLYAHAVVENAKALAGSLVGHGFALSAGGTDNHLMLVDLRPKGVTGVQAEKALGRAHITCNKNGIPFDPEKPTITSGVRLGSPAATTRGFGIAEFHQVGDLITEVIEGLAKNGEEGNGSGRTGGESKSHGADGALPDLLKIALKVAHVTIAAPPGSARPSHPPLAGREYASHPQTKFGNSLPARGVWRVQCAGWGGRTSKADR